MALLRPEFEGELEVASLPDDFADRIRRRVESGLFIPGRRSRADYRVENVDRSGITFAAGGLLTAYNIGLNVVNVQRVGADRIRYRVSYWRWTRIAALHGALLGILFLASYAFFPFVRRDVASYPHGAEIFWGMVFFWCVAWPWVLSAIHRGPAERALQRILRETLVGPAR